LAALPDNTDARRIKAAIFERLGRNAEAGLLEEELSGSGIIRAILEARAASLEGDSERALTILRKALEDDPTDVRLVSALVEELAGLNRREEAEKVVQEAIEKHPDDTTLQRLAISVRSGLTPEQRDEAMLKLIGSETDAYKRALEMVTFYSRKNDAASMLEAVAEAEQHLKASDTPMAQRATAVQHAALLRTKLRAAAQLNDEAAMAAARDEGAKSNVDGSGGKSILGFYHLLRREYELSAQAFRAALQEQPTQVLSMIFLGQCLQALGRTDEAQEEFARASRINPNEAPAHQGLALLARMRGDTATFQRELAVCERLMPDDPWVREQVLVRSEEADPAGAIQRREQQQTVRPEDTANLLRLASLYETVKDQDKAYRAYARLLVLLPDDARMAAMAATYFRRTGRTERALEVVKQYAESRPTKEQQAGAAILVANEYFQQGDMRAVERTLLGAADVAMTLEVAQTLADFYLQRAGQAGKALTWFDKAVELAAASQSPYFAAILERRVGCLLDRDVNDWGRARRDVAELRRLFPDNVRGLLLESEVHARAGEINEAVASLSDYLTKRPDDSYALFQRARHEVARGREAAAI
ncbi:MAG: tetratricopeptide repeat protein, partial [Phycisphaerales bacterium]|nr:tetratricopeptide repeat protein [Phycisphaerales bacterium]